MSTTIRQEVTLSATPEQIYRALMNSSEHSQVTGAPAEVSADEGGTCSWHGGHVTGRNVELVPNKRIVQAWRVQAWDEGVYSLIRYELAAADGATRIVFEQSGHPDGTAEHLESGWHERYWKPLEAYLARS